jgi:hypothetical protein
MENVGTINGYLEYLRAIWYILLSFGIFYCRLVYFYPFWFVKPRQIWQPYY